MSRRRDPLKVLEPPLDPMVDVVFMLLIFFLFAFQVKLLEHTVALRPAREGSAIAGPPPPVVWLRANAAGLASFAECDGQRHDTAMSVVDALRARAATAPVVVPDPSLRFDELVEYLATLRSAGLAARLATPEADDETP